MIPVTRSYLPNKDKYKSYIDKIYDSAWLTNNGSLLQELEDRLRAYLGVKHIILVANGSLALQLAYKALDLKGEVITTPFTFAATTNTLAWDKIKPVFADVKPKTFNLDPAKIESLITDRTSAILPVHVFGNPCEVEFIKQIADKHDLKVVYDAAHAFGVNYSGESLLNFGDISTVSFHATKLFHTIEGGAIITNDDDLATKVRLLTSFGLKNATSIVLPGINAKMNEFEAAMGLCVLDEVGAILAQRKIIGDTYRRELGSYLQLQEWHNESNRTDAYFPVLFENEACLLRVEKALIKQSVFPRRYFYPSLDTLDYLQSEQNCAVSRDIASRILCLPIYPGLTTKEQQLIIKIIENETK